MIAPSTPIKTSKKKFIIPTIIGVVVLAVIVTVVTILIITNSPFLDEETGGVYDISFEEGDGYSEMLNIYNNVWNGMTEERMMDVLEQGKIDESYVQINKETGEGYIANTPIESGVDYSGQNIEYISFTYLPEDEDSSMPSIDDVTYHCFLDGEHDFIYESSDGEFTHYSNDGMTNSYEDKTSAIDSYLMEIDS